VAGLRANEQVKDREIVILLDNVRLHKTPSVIATAKRLGVTMLFSAQYSPFLNPIE
jgi:transposase